MRATGGVAERLAFAAAAVAAGTATFVGSSPARASLTPDALERARVIRAEVDSRYGRLPGRRLRVTEATGTSVVQSLTLITDWLDVPEVVPADNGIYFAICPARAKCPYPARSAAWHAAAVLPRRQALELALRTFLETSATLVVVALPTAEPTWVVFQRDGLLASIDASSVLEQLAGQHAIAQTSLRDLVRTVTRPRLFLPLPILPPPDHTIYAVQLFRS
jgi:hypothetical protein